MIYNNEKLNIKIENAEYFTIDEYDEYVELYSNDLIMFKIYHNSKIKAYNNSTVRAYNNSTVYAYNNSTVYAYNNSTVYAYNNSKIEAYNNSTVRAYDFSCVYQNSTNAKITVDNPFVKVFGQVFKVPKKMLVYKKLRGDLIAILQLEKGQRFQSELQDKCRTDKALVVSIENIDGTVKYDKGYSQNDNSFVYKVGKVVSAMYDENIEECSTGIHFFLSRHSAERY